MDSILTYLFWELSSNFRCLVSIGFTLAMPIINWLMPKNLNIECGPPFWLNRQTNWIIIKTHPPRPSPPRKENARELNTDTRTAITPNLNLTAAVTWKSDAQWRDYSWMWGRGGFFLLSLHLQVIEPVKFLIKIRMSRIKQLNLLHVDPTNANKLHCLCVVWRGKAA